MMIILFILIIMISIIIFIFLRRTSIHNNDSSEDIPLISVVSPKNVTIDERFNQYHYF